MTVNISRKEFLQASGMASAGSLLPRWISFPDQTADADAPNFIIIVFDALSALDLATYDYPRSTAPNLARFAESATVYHNHFAGGNFTTPGTASLLTGDYPFNHRAYRLNIKTIPRYTDQNIFSQFPDYTRIAYSHNVLANTLLQQFGPGIDELKRREELFINSDYIVTRLFANDNDIAQVSWIRIIKEDEDRYTNSLFFAGVNKEINQRLLRPHEARFPRGVPEIGTGEHFLLESATDWIGGQLPQVPQPFLGYFHLMPPHHPYNAPVDFIDTFLKDGYAPAAKPGTIFSNAGNQMQLNEYRRFYDEFILYADQAFGQLYRQLEQTGMLDNTWLIFTSDHGEMFERGIWKHTTQTLYQPIVRIPLFIQAPGQGSRNDVYSPTSAVDILPTLLHLGGKPPAPWGQGTVLPPYREAEIEDDRSIYTLEAKNNKKTEPLTTASTMLLKWPYKLVQFRGYKELAGGPPAYEMYNLEDDPEELEDIFSSSDSKTKEMVEEINHTLSEADKPYTRS